MSAGPGRPVFLTGMMGAGKSTIAPLLADPSAGAIWARSWPGRDGAGRAAFVHSSRQ